MSDHAAHAHEDAHADELGPVDLIVVGFPDGAPHPEGFDLLLGLVDRGVIQILDVEFVTGSAAGAQTVAASALPTVAGFDPELWGGASSGLIGDDDLAEIGEELEPGELAAVILLEQHWLLHVVDTWRGSGARLIAEGGIPVQDLIEALDAAEQR